MKPFFSVVIPTLNEENFVGNLLNNLIAENVSDLEIIVVDGESIDNTIQIVNEFKKKFSKNKILLTLVKSKIRNAAYQRNLGAKYAMGDYLIFFDADVKIRSDYLKRLKYYLEEEDYSKNLVTTIVKTDQGGIEGLTVAIIVNTMIVIGRLINKPVTPGFNTIVKKEVFFEVGGFDPEVNVTDDYDFSLRAMHKGYSLKVFRQLYVTFSLRRFRSKGFMRTLIKYFQMFVYNFFKGPPRKQVFIYPMGGHAHKL